MVDELIQSIKKGEELEEHILGVLADELRRMKAAYANQKAALDIISDLEKEHGADKQKVLKEIKEIREDIIVSFKLDFRDYRLFRKPDSFLKRLEHHFDEFDYPQQFEELAKKVENLFDRIEKLLPQEVREDKAMRSAATKEERDIKTGNMDEARELLQKLKTLLQSSIGLHQNLLRLFTEAYEEVQKLEHGSKDVEHKLEKSE